jgi:hypothetical protein
MARPARLQKPASSSLRPSSKLLEALPDKDENGECVQPGHLQHGRVR